MSRGRAVAALVVFLMSACFASTSPEGDACPAARAGACDEPPAEAQGDAEAGDPPPRAMAPVADAAAPEDPPLTASDAGPIEIEPGPGAEMAGGPRPETYLEGCNAPAAYDALGALPGERCHAFAVHGVSEPGDTTPLTIQGGEAYHQLYYAVPWEEGSVGTRFGIDWANIQVLHAFRAFSSRAPEPDGAVRENVTGTTLGEQARLLAAWHVGGCNMALPPDVSLELPGQRARRSSTRTSSSTTRSTTRSTRARSSSRRRRSRRPASTSTTPVGACPSDVLPAGLRLPATHPRRPRGPEPDRRPQHLPEPVGWPGPGVSSCTSRCSRKPAFREAAAETALACRRGRRGRS